VRYLDLIVNGTVVERRFAPQGRTEWAVQHRLPLRASSWIAARTHADAGTEAHTNPVYVYFGQTRPFNAASVRQIIARIEGSMAAIPLPAIVARLGALREELQRMLRDPSQTTLPLPRPEP
jgi:hypothetical protein